MEKKRPEISIVMPTHNRASSALRTLGALRNQTYHVADMEVVVVADGCTDDTANILKGHEWPFTMQFIAQPGAGAAAARNRGASAAKGRIIIFLDDDIEVSPGFVAAHCNVHRNAPRHVVVGYSRPAFRQDPGELGKDLKAWWEGRFEEMGQYGYRFAYIDLFSGNFSIDADLFREMKGFDESFLCREDYELGVRLIRSGASFAFSSEAMGDHYESADPDRMLRRVKGEGTADFRLCKLYPELRRSLPLSHFETRRSSLNNMLISLAFGPEKAGHAFAALVLWLLVPGKYLLRRKHWKKAFEALRKYSYWKGVAEEAGSIENLDNVLQNGPSLSARLDSAVDIDIGPGISSAEAVIERGRPRSVHIYFGSFYIGNIPDKPGAERLRPAHLRAVLATCDSETLLSAMALQKIRGGSFESNGAGYQVPSPAGGLAVTPDSLSALSYRPPIKIAELELSNGAKPIEGTTYYYSIRILVRLRGTPLGWVDIDNSLHLPKIESGMVEKAVSKQLSGALFTTLVEIPADIRGRKIAPPPISVAVCTRDRTEQLSKCLDAVLKLDYPDYEVLVVDNAPQDSTTEELVSKLPVRYIREDRPGLDYARNRAIAEARNGLIAFTDDDARPDSQWLKALDLAFTDPDVMAVTGFVAPAEMVTPAQVLFEFKYGGMSKGFMRKIISRNGAEPRSLFWASGFGVGANMAFRREVFDSVGLFDIRLDVGTPSRGGGDIEMFNRIVSSGHSLVYEPSALVWHFHRRSRLSLARQLHSNGCGFGSYLLTSLRHSRNFRPLLYFAVKEWFGWWLLRRIFRPEGFPRRLVLCEIAGALRSPFAYMASRKLSARPPNTIQKGSASSSIADA